MTPIQIIALIFCVVAAIKILVFAFSPKAWMKLAKGMWKNPMLGIIYFILLVIVFYFLIKEISVTQILAVAVFLALLMGLQLSRYSKDAMDFAQKFVKNKKDLWKKNWIYVLIWVVLIVWGLIEIL